jgi:hypothetical protein
MEARVGIGQFPPRLQANYARFYWLLNIDRLNPAIPFLTRLVSVLVSGMPNFNALLAVMGRAQPLLERVTKP